MELLNNKLIQHKEGFEEEEVKTFNHHSSGNYILMQQTLCVDASPNILRTFPERVNVFVCSDVT